MELMGLKSMRITVVGFGAKAYEVYFLSFGKSLVGFIPELAMCASGWNEPEVVSLMREQMIQKGIIGDEFAQHKPLGEGNEQQSTVDSPARAGRKGRQPGLF